jgi:4-alpha-glucanotransferase
VWGAREYFDLTPEGHPRVVAGVPPDYFSATGQRWGNPHYDWAVMEADGFRWWMGRLRSQLELYDWVRIDHFRGFEAYWEIPAEAKTAIEGRWIKAPGERLLETALRTFSVRGSSLPLIAEDLGIITPEVDALRDRFALPGMKILQFAFDGGPTNPYLPHNHPPNSVVYTGTHDNDTTLSWFEALDAEQQQHIYDYLGFPEIPMPLALIRSALASDARLSMVPMQDLLGLGKGYRMNTPGTLSDDNWQWRFCWSQVEEARTRRVADWLRLYGRAGGDPRNQVVRRLASAAKPVLRSGPG